MRCECILRSSSLYPAHTRVTVQRRTLFYHSACPIECSRMYSSGKGGEDIVQCTPVYICVCEHSPVTCEVSGGSVSCPC